MSFVLYMIAVALASTQPEAAAMIKGAVEAYVGASPSIARQLNLVETEALDEERARQLGARGADMDWDQAVAFTLTHTTQALDELQIQGSAMSKSPGTPVRNGHSAQRRAHVKVLSTKSDSESRSSKMKLRGRKPLIFSLRTPRRDHTGRRSWRRLTGHNQGSLLHLANGPLREFQTE